MKLIHKNIIDKRLDIRDWILEKKNRKRVTIIGGILMVLIVLTIIIISSGGIKSDALILSPTAANSTGPNQNNSSPKVIGDGNYDYTEAIDHIGEKATVSGTVSKVFTSKSGTVFFDFCENFETCPFSAVIFASDVPKFKDLSRYEREVKITGMIKSYQGKAEIILNGPEQIQ